MRAVTELYRAVFPVSYNEDQHHLWQQLFKSKLRRAVNAAFFGKRFSHLSPPMSSPPSHSRVPGEPATTTSAPVSTSQEFQATSFPGLASGGPPATSYPSTPHGLPAATPTTGLHRSSSRTTTSAVSLPAPVRTTTSSIAIAGPSSVRGGRKPKAHVASACINCKRAHLSCDVNRPCARCVASGKQDSCYDVQHKKRGRPRLREEEEEEFKVGTMMPDPSAQVTPLAITAQTPRPIAATRRTRRGDSFRSIQSMTSEDSSTYSISNPGYPFPSPTQVRYARPSWPADTAYDYETPIALLDLNLDILRANRAFDTVVLDGRSSRGSHLADIVMPADEHSIHAIRNRLKAEREAREPTHMPPILHPGQDLLGHITDSEADQLAQEYTDNTYTWSQLREGVRGHTFTARVRLAKASIYFVVVTLPLFRPVEAPQQVNAPYNYSYASGSQTRPSQTDRTGRLQQPATPLTPLRQPFPISHTMPQQQVVQTYPMDAPAEISSRQAAPFQQRDTQTSIQPLMPSLSRTPSTAPRTDFAATDPRPGARDLIESVGNIPSVLQLPPMGVSSTQTTVAGPQGERRINSPREALSRRDSDDESTEGTPKRRRRMGIDDVLHR